MTVRLCLILAALLVSAIAGLSGCTGDSGSGLEPTSGPTAIPHTLEPTAPPTEEAARTPTAEPAVVPTPEPTATPAAEPATTPTPEPTEAPTPEPTMAPTTEPTTAPTVEPTEAPTAEPTEMPTAEPTEASTAEPTAASIPEPTATPAPEPTAPPTPAARVRAEAEKLSLGPRPPEDCDSSIDEAARQALVVGRLQWSPDGSQVLFTQLVDRLGPPIGFVEADGSRLGGFKDVPTTSTGDKFPLITRETSVWEDATANVTSRYAGPMSTFDVSADGSRIAYSTCGYAHYASDDDYKIVVSNIDGTDTKRLTDNVSPELYPVWSPDGTRVAFIRYPALTIYAVATGESTNAPSYFSHPVAPIPPAWSPDGGSIAFLAFATKPRNDFHWLSLVSGATVDVYTVGSDGSGLRKIVSNAVSAPSWSPDGERMAVAVSEGDGVALYTFAADGSDPVMVARIDATDMVDRSGGHDHAALWVPNVSWSPDGSKIMYGALSVVNVDDGLVVLDTQLIRFEWVGSYGTRSINYEEAGATPLATWSPDGSRIAVLAPAIPTRQIGYWELERYPVLYTMNSDGTNPRILVGRKDGSMTTWLLPMRLGADPEACSGGVVVPDPEENPGLVEDCRTLLEMRDKIAGSGGSLPWSSDAQITQWGVRLGGEPLRVTALYLSEWDRSISGELYGQIPPEIGNLAELRELTIEAAHINGRIPPEIGRLTNLESLELSFTHMGGRIPAEIGKLTNLKRLVLHGSQFSGSIPSEIGKLTNLTHLDLGDNELTGRIPSELSTLFNLTYFNLYFNRLAGCLPVSDQPRIRRCN